MVNRRSSRAKKPVSYANYDVTGEEPNSDEDVTIKKKKKVNKVVCSAESADEDYVVKEENECSSNGSDHAEDDVITIESELKKYRAATELGSPEDETVESQDTSKLSVVSATITFKRGRDDISDNAKENNIPSAQEKRLLDLQKSISKRAKKDIVIASSQEQAGNNHQTGQVIPDDRPGHEQVLTNLNAIRAQSTPLRTVNSYIADKGKSKAKGRKSNKIDGNTLEQWRRKLGNGVKSNIKFQHYAIDARTHFVSDFTLNAFRALIVPNATNVYPDDFDESTPVVLASIENTQQARDVFGSSKIKGGSRVQTWEVDRADFTYVAAKKEIRVWWTMGGGNKNFGRYGWW